MHTITPGYAELNAQLHQSNPNYGTSSGRWAGVVRDLAGFLGSRDILDYGCGKQRLAAGLPELPVRGYDPAIPGLDAQPEPADLVVCTDVLEHVEPELVDNVLDDLTRLTRKLGFFTVATRPAVKVLADGRNAHLTQQPIEWWLAKLEKRFTVLSFYDYGGQEFLVLVASNVTGVDLAPSSHDGRLGVAVQGANVSLRLPAALSAAPVEMSPEEMLVLAQNHRQAGALDEAEVLLRELAAHYHDFPEALIELGQLLKEKREGAPKSVISADYARLNAELHARNPQYGISGQRWAPVVSGLAGWLPTQDILDYGCGKQTLAANLPQLPVRGYDPALPGLNGSPSPADLVVCTDVLEHVEPELVDNVLDDLVRVTRKLGFFTVATRSAVKVLADGRNAHLTVKPIEWWLAKFRTRFNVHESRDYGGQEFYLLVSARGTSLRQVPSVEALQATPHAASPAPMAAPAQGGITLMMNGDTTAPMAVANGSAAAPAAQAAQVNREQELRSQLEATPSSLDALAELASLLFQQGHLNEAEKLLRRAYRLRPDWPELLNNLGHLLMQRENFGEAAGYFQRATELQPNYATAWNSLGVVQMRQNQLRQAEQAFQCAIQLKPSYALAWVNLGLVQVESGSTEAETTLLHALLYDATNPDVLLALAELYLAQQEIEKAVACLQVLITAGNAAPEVYFRAGALYRKIDREEEGVKIFEEAVYLHPEIPSLRKGLAAVYADVGRYEEAAAILRQLDQDDPEAVNMLGVAYRGLGFLDLAEAQYLRCMILKPDFADPYINMGQISDMRGDVPLAVEWCNKVLAFQPDNYRALMNSAVMLDRTGQTKAAEERYQRIVANKAYTQEAHHNLSLLYLREGRLGEGWDEYRWRNARYNFEMGGKHWKPNAQCLPEDLHGKKVLVLGEQGIGDELFFARWLPELVQRGARISYGLKSPKLASLMLQLTEIKQWVDKREWRKAEVDYTVQAGDLPYMLTSFETPPARPLQADPSLMASLREEWFSRFPAKPFIGVTWRAGLVRTGVVKNRDRTLEKSLPLEMLALALANVDANYVVLQRDPEAEEMQLLADTVGANLLDLSHLSDDLPRMLALLDMLDEVVGVSNTNMHLRASLGKTSSVLVPQPGEFRWGTEGGSPWFPSCPVYRQQLDGDWVPALLAFNADLLARFGEI